MRGLSNTEATEMKETYSKIKVIPLDVNKMNAELDAHIKAEAAKANDSEFAPKIKEGEIFGVRGEIGIIKTKGGKLLVIDKECVGEIVKHGDSITLDIHSETVKSPTEKSFTMFARFTCKQKIDDLLAEYALAEVDLPTFMGSRYAYNPRIVSNMSVIKKEANKK